MGNWDFISYKFCACPDRTRTLKFPSKIKFSIFLLAYVTKKIRHRRKRKKKKKKTVKEIEIVVEHRMSELQGLLTGLEIVLGNMLWTIAEVQGSTVALSCGIHHVICLCI